jgi:hypothetical protein
VKKCVAYLYKKIQRKRSTSSELDYRGKKRYREKKDIIYKGKKERKLVQKEVK